MYTRFRFVPKSMTLDDRERSKGHSCRKKRFTELTRTLYLFIIKIVHWVQHKKRKKLKYKATLCIVTDT